ncbi:MAG: hypothetical protein Q4C37_01345 [Bacteroidales bacterium]|nr:hypothetical protein [Bacteroidales bacterium]
MKSRFILAALSCACGLGAMAQADALRFDPDAFTRARLTMPDEQEVAYKAYEGIYYVSIPWNRPHSGDYNLDDLFSWIATTLKK